MAFLITHDFICDGEDTGTVGPRTVTPEQEKALATSGSGRVHFHMYDDDGERYYSGFWIGTDGSDELQALDCFGMPNAGCTEIRMPGKDGTYTAV